MGAQLCGDKDNNLSEMDTKKVSSKEYLTKLYTQEEEFNITKVQKFAKVKMENKRNAKDLVEALKAFDENIQSRGKYTTTQDLENQTPKPVKELEKKLGYFKVENPNAQPDESQMFMREPIRFTHDDSIYYGQWNRTTEREGYGILVRVNGQKLEGLWQKNNIFKGRIMNPDGSYYEGDIENELPNGKGVCVNNEANYRGSFKHYKPHGDGQMDFFDQTTYVGNFFMGDFTGKGKMTWNKLGSYEGDFVDNKLHGEGVFTTIDKNVYKGSFNANQIDGKGVYTWYNKGGKETRFEGVYKNGKKFQGKYNVDKDIYYQGTFANNMPEGTGKFVKGNDSFEGVFKKGKYDRPITTSGDTNTRVKLYDTKNDVILSTFSKEDIPNESLLLHLKQNEIEVVKKINFKDKVIFKAIIKETLNNMEESRIPNDEIADNSTNDKNKDNNQKNNIIANSNTNQNPSTNNNVNTNPNPNTSNNVNTNPNPNTNTTTNPSKPTTGTTVTANNKINTSNNVTSNNNPSITNQNSNNNGNVNATGNTNNPNNSNVNDKETKTVEEIRK